MSSELFVQFGSIELNPKSSRRANVSVIVRHEGYNPTITIHDIALLKLEQALSYAQVVKAIKLPEKEKQTFAANESIKLLGWGLNATFGSLQVVLQQVEMQLLGLAECRQQLGSVIHASNLCAAALKGSGIVNGQCSGDSGGPLLLKDTQIGIVSWSLKPCASKAVVFTNVAFYKSWLQEKQSILR